VSRTRTSSRKSLLLAVCLAAVTAVEAQTPAPAKPASVAGKWTMTINMDVGTATTALELKQDTEKLTGTYTGRYGSFAVTGTIKARAIEFWFEMGTDDQKATMSFAGEVAADGQTMKGTASMGEQLGEASWSAKRNKDGSAALHAGASVAR
jgi:hypothetical protein